jgi:hypothetical protein
MTESEFLNQYANRSLLKLWKAAAPDARRRVLDLFGVLRAAPLRGLDQYTHDFEGWPRLVLGFKDPGRKAPPGSVQLYVDLTPRRLEIHYGLNPRREFASVGSDVDRLRMHLQDPDNRVAGCIQAVLNRPNRPMRAPYVPRDYD